MHSFYPASRALIPALAFLLMACGSARHTIALPGEDLSDFVLLIREEPNGHVSHTWQRATEGSLTQDVPECTMKRGLGNIVFAAQRPRDCDQEQIDCVRDCMSRRLSSAFDHIKRSDGSKRRFCATECLNEYMDCLKSQQALAIQFNAVDNAVDWVKRNREGLLVSTIIVIAGVAFVTVSAGAGAVILAPVVLVAS